MSIASLIMVDVDCANPPEMATFYGRVLGWETTASQDEYSMITGGNGASIGFGKVEGYRPPSWPDTEGVKRWHLDLQVDDLDAAEKECHALGATTPEFQPGGEGWRVLLDPAGQPFCLCPKRD